ncbi:hypothetical protein K1T71_001164 [Dendrolimus kikuchii]|uniref:Uncharacterized protein n=1 Tax=Dendrolimus kikuchii TaxID=765133 RepID=A0ACC1DGV8_9NEOP|nr:hypothetical protein K1T71_001164 [Dendrolimus kikuchii]
MMTVFVFTVVFCILSQIIAGYRPNNGGSDSHHNKRDLLDLIRWWDHEMPDWAKSKEEIDKPYYLSFLHPFGPGTDFEDSGDEEEDYDYGPVRYRHINWKPDSLGNIPENGKNNRFQSSSRTETFEGTTDNVKWLQSSDFETISQANLNNKFSKFTQTTSVPNNLITRFTRQSADINLFGIQNPSTITTPLSSTINECINRCPVTSEYYPVCGTDNITYSNQGRLACARFCGVDVSLRRNTPCTTFGIDEHNNAPQPSRVNRPTTMDLVPNMNSQSCINKCPRQGETDPVCGSDGRTYNNPKHLLCAQLCGSDVKVQKLTACSNNNNVGVSSPSINFNTDGGLETNTQSNVQPNPLSNSGSSSANSATNNVNPGNNFGFSFNDNVKTTTISPYVRSCLTKCSNTAENKPVCGSNGVVYSNLNLLTCARICGVDVQQRPSSFCLPVTSTSTTESITTSTTTTLNSLECRKTCRLPPEVKPVCGTNGVTYQNIAYLECVKMCGTDVELQSNSSCQDEFTTTAILPVTAPEPNPETTTQASSVSGHNGSGTEIAPDILNSVFNTNYNATTTTESDIDYEFIRINEK